MKRADYFWLLSLAVSAFLIWSREAQRAALPAADTLPLLLAFPLFWKLGGPWNFLAWETPLPMLPLLAALLLGVLGEALGQGMWSALGWSIALGTWLKWRTGDSRHRLLLLTVLGFPWLVGAAGGLGWQFRGSAAWVAEQVYTAGGFSIAREGTILSIQGERLGVEAACAGLGSLQAMLLAGAAAASIELASHRRFWLCLPLLFVAAWCANTLRVVLICAAALTAGHDFASGPIHGFTGWLVLSLTFAGCLALFRRWGAPPVRRTIIGPATALP